MEKKYESQKLLETEELSLKGKTSSVKPKVTRVQIAESSSSSGATPLPTGVVEVDPLLENPNHLMRQRVLEGHHDAETVDEALQVLSLTSDSIERHPEKRLKAAYTVFEEREISRLRLESPNLRLSQVKQLVRKEWVKSPDNPLNQSHASYRDNP